MVDLPVGEPLEIRLEEPEGSLAAMAGATSDDEAHRIAARWPECLAAWAMLGDTAYAQGRFVDAYAFYRVGYHRGLDRLRKSGWRGSGRVPWAHEANRGFLGSLRGLGLAAHAIGEDSEAERCRDFFQQLSPDAPSS